MEGEREGREALAHLLDGSSSSRVSDTVLVDGAVGCRPGGTEGVVAHLRGHQVGGRLQFNS